MVRKCRCRTKESAAILQEKVSVEKHNRQRERVRDCRHITGDGLRVHTNNRSWSKTADVLLEMIRDYRYFTGYGQNVQTYYRKWSEIADMLQEMIRDYRCITEDSKRVQAFNRR